MDDSLIVSSLNPVVSNLDEKKNYDLENVVISRKNLEWVQNTLTQVRKETKEMLDEKEKLEIKMAELDCTNDFLKKSNDELENKNNLLEEENKMLKLELEKKSESFFQKIKNRFN